MTAVYYLARSLSQLAGLKLADGSSIDRSGDPGRSDYCNP